MGHVSLFQKITSYDGLLSAWTKVRDNRGACGGDGQSMASFGRNLDRNLRKFFAGDIDDNFDNLPYSKLITIIKTYIDDVKVARLVSLWLSPFHLEGTGIAQSSPLSRFCPTFTWKT